MCELGIFKPGLGSGQEIDDVFQDKVVHLFFLGQYDQQVSNTLIVRFLRFFKVKFLTLLFKGLRLLVQLRANLLQVCTVDLNTI